MVLVNIGNAEDFLFLVDLDKVCIFFDNIFRYVDNVCRYFETVFRVLLVF